MRAHPLDPTAADTEIAANELHAIAPVALSDNICDTKAAKLIRLRRICVPRVGYGKGGPQVRLFSFQLSLLVTV